MRLKTQREDVKYLEKLAENRLSLRRIARRYLNLIRMAVEQLDPNRDIVRLIRKERVVRKDGETR